MKPDLFKNLLPEIITEILLRLPVVSIPISKCVCKRWLHLLDSDAFVKSHFARSAPALAVLGYSGRLKVLELEGELNLHLHLHLDPLTQYDFPYHPTKIYSSVNGFLVLSKKGYDSLRARVDVDMLCVCNPITREVIKLDLRDLSSEEVSAYGFGTSKISGRYKADLGDALKVFRMCTCMVKVHLLMEICIGQQPLEEKRHGFLALMLKQNVLASLKLLLIMLMDCPSLE
ncbi:F-box protein CPR1-like isoform X2 [Salvia miltiorrhiza]|uniref:F-box protein CPR1-like isoform X2 n=1 Tax=Salvia miltiorrhiza TaxID=226208 RepID=UPI0025ACBE01|nr:F-box protein CPR1-like isoform X2 [Salvia miltiorrhiza]